MWTVLATVVITLAVAGAVIKYAPPGWRTRITMWGATAVGVVSGLLDQFSVVDWSRLIDAPKVAYGLMISIPIVGSWLRELTKEPAGKK